MTQWDMTVIESLGLLKMDFLGLRTLTVLDDAVKIVRHLGTALDLDEIPLDDPETFRIFSDGRTSGIFQFESRGMTDLLRRFKPSRFEELAALNALYRPGAMTLVDEYIQRKQGKKFTYLAPEMQPILEETYGIIVYQEQVMLIGVAVAGFTMAEADMLRKAMGKKKADVMAKMKAQFVDGAENRGMPRQKASDLWDRIEPFAGYGFNKSHSVAYANLAYKTAYLKAHYPVAFMAAMLNSELSSSTRSRNTSPSAATWASSCCRRTSTRAATCSPSWATRSATAWAPSREWGRAPSSPCWRRARRWGSSAVWPISPLRSICAW